MKLAECGIWHSRGSRTHLCATSATRIIRRGSCFPACTIRRSAQDSKRESGEMHHEGTHLLHGGDLVEPAVVCPLGRKAVALQPEAAHSRDGSVPGGRIGLVTARGGQPHLRCFRSSGVSAFVDLPRPPFPRLGRSGGRSFFGTLSMLKVAPSGTARTKQTVSAGLAAHPGMPECRCQVPRNGAHQSPGPSRTTTTAGCRAASPPVPAPSRWRTDPRGWCPRAALRTDAP